MTGINYSDGRLSHRGDGWFTEVAILALCALLGYLFYDGILTVHNTLHLLGLR